ncbi:MAG: hypothetical protein L0323_20205 [Planctomycetes bacterium]|nr:hypothetical protein [Planctomycetota bacterium]
MGEDDGAPAALEVGDLLDEGGDPLAGLRGVGLPVERGEAGAQVLGEGGQGDSFA